MDTLRQRGLWWTLTRCTLSVHMSAGARGGSTISTGMDEFITKRMDEARQRVIRARHIADVAAAAATSEFPAPGISTEVTLSYMSEILAEADLALDEALSRLAAIASTGRRTNDDG